MPQTESTYRALQRDNYQCQWCLKTLWIITKTWTGHHIKGRAISDKIKDIISLCPKHHDMAHRHEITKEELFGIINRITG